MYGIHLPPEQLMRLYYLKKYHDLGSIKAQVVNAIENYLEEKEKQYAAHPDPPGQEPRRAGDPR